jgi:hypothetical protein
VAAPDPRLTARGLTLTKSSPVGRTVHPRPGGSRRWPVRAVTPGRAVASAAEAMQLVMAGLDWLAAADATSLPAGVQADCLRGLERAVSVHTAARARVLAAFTAKGGYEDDEQGSPRTWLTWQTRVTRPAAAAALAWTRRLADHPAVAEALAHGQISVSWARQICDWTSQLPAGHRDQADAILLAAAAGGADLAGLAELAEQIRARLAVPDRDRGDGFADRGLRLATTSLANCRCCAPSTLIAIHRWGWTITLHADGTTTMTSPDCRTLHSHSPPAAA